MAKRRVIIDTDAGVDDAVAIMMALVHPELEVVAITTVYGNADVDQVNINVAKVLEYMGREDVPIYGGCDSPLVTPRIKPGWLGHGKDGLADIPWLSELPRSKKLENERAADAIVRLIQEAPTSIVALGPLTNLALAMKLFPRFFDVVELLTVMGGTMHGKGNTTKGAEFNFHQDPEAVFITLQHALPDKYLLVPWEVTLEQSPVGWPFYDTLPQGEGTDLRFARLVRGLCSPQDEVLHREMDLTLCDPVTMLCFMAPSKMIVQAHELHAEIELSGTMSRGTILYDWYNYQPSVQKNVRLVTSVDGDYFRQVLSALFSRDEVDASPLLDEGVSTD